jgi:hypothetical protein
MYSLYGAGAAPWGDEMIWGLSPVVVAATFIGAVV